MTGDELKSARQLASQTQQQAAASLNVSQAYLSLLERGLRPIPLALAARVAQAFPLPPTSMPLGTYRFGNFDTVWFKEQLGALGYPGFAYLRAQLQTNPADFLLQALDSEDLDARVTEALPWVPVAFPHLDWTWLIANAKYRDRQNRLGFILDLATRIAATRPDPTIANQLSSRKQALENSRLAKQDTLCRTSMTQAELRWLEEHRSPAAHHWNLLTGLKLEHLDHALL